MHGFAAWSGSVLLFLLFEKKYRCLRCCLLSFSKTKEQKKDVSAAVSLQKKRGNKKDVCPLLRRRKKGSYVVLMGFAFLLCEPRLCFLFHIKTHSRWRHGGSTAPARLDFRMASPSRTWVSTFLLRSSLYCLLLNNTKSVDARKNPRGIQ
jgi:hypothetical protein